MKTNLIYKIAEIALTIIMIVFIILGALMPLSSHSMPFIVIALVVMGFISIIDFLKDKKNNRFYKIFSIILNTIIVLFMILGSGIIPSTSPNEIFLYFTVIAFAIFNFIEPFNKKDNQDKTNFENTYIHLIIGICILVFGTIIFLVDN